jgi:uncharacterized protein (TIGR03086 family)
MELLEAHRRAQDAFGLVLQKVSHDQWRGSTPCPEWDVAALVRHVVGGNQRVQELAGDQPVALPDEPASAHLVSAAAAQQVFEAPDGLTRPFQLPFATLPGSAFIGIRSSDVFTHAWDLAVATGQPTDLDDELAAQLLETSRRLLPPQLRGEGKPFGEERPCPPGRPEADQLAAFLGRTVG